METATVKLIAEIIRVRLNPLIGSGRFLATASRCRFGADSGENPEESSAMAFNLEPAFIIR
ncbi:MAG: hypothetical protein IPG01_18655 [Chitinophagaceae bacterium]|nr:hypothetical protein [Chitinophagaceae bacterium]